jgi:hypothetical protein
MPINLLVRFSCWLIISTLLLGCVNNKVQIKHPSANLSQIKHVYVKKHTLDRHGINQLICDRLNEMGIDASTGGKQLDNIDTILTYTDHWRWDITMYMLSLDIKLSDPDTGFPLASGQVLHTSLTRRTPQAMVSEVLHNILLQ